MRLEYGKTNFSSIFNFIFDIFPHTNFHNLMSLPSLALFCIIRIAQHFISLHNNALSHSFFSLCCIIFTPNSIPYARVYHHCLTQTPLINTSPLLFKRIFWELQSSMGK